MTAHNETSTSAAHGSHTTVARPARVYDVLLGGKDNYRPDREASAAMVAALPTLPAMVRANRAFLGRAVRHLVADHRIVQFLDLGCGLPSVDPVHEVAHQIDPTARVVCCDNDPLVLAHCRALLTNGATAGQIEVMAGDVRDPHALLGHPVLGATVDDTRPVAVMLVSLLMYFTDEEVHRLIGAVVEAMPPGSVLTVSHPTADFDPDAVGAAVAAARHRGVIYRPRTRTEVERLFAGLDLLDPGVVPLLDWRPTVPEPDPERVYYWAGMARIPGHASP